MRSTKSGTPASVTGRSSSSSYAGTTTATRFPSTIGALTLRERGGERRGDGVDLGALEAREHRQREAPAAPVLGRGEVARAVAELGEYRLEMQRPRVVHARADPALGQGGTDAVPLVDADHVQVPDVLPSFCLGGK